MLKKIISAFLIYFLTFNSLGSELSVKNRIQYIKNTLGSMTQTFSENNVESLKFIHEELEKIDQLETPYNHDFTTEDLGKVKKYLEHVKNMMGLKSMGPESSGFFESVWNWLVDASPYIILGFLAVGALILNGCKVHREREKDDDMEDDDILKLPKLGQTPKFTLNFYGNFTISSDGKYVAGEERDGSAKVINLLSNKKVSQIQNHGEAHARSFHPQGGYLVSGYNKKPLTIWNLHSRSNVVKLKKPLYQKVSTLSWGPKGNYIAVGTFKNKIIILNHSMNKLASIIKYNAYRFDAISWDPEERYVVVAASDNTVKIWNASSGKKVADLGKHNGRVFSVDWSKDGKWIASGSGDRTIKIWNAQTKLLLRELKANSGTVYSVTFSPDGKYLVSGFSDGTIKIWEVSTGQELFTKKLHYDAVSDVVWSADGKYIVSGAIDNSVKKWPILYHDGRITVDSRTYDEYQETHKSFRGCVNGATSMNSYSAIDEALFSCLETYRDSIRSSDCLHATSKFNSYSSSNRAKFFCLKKTRYKPSISMCSKISEEMTSYSNTTEGLSYCIRSNKNRILAMECSKLAQSMASNASINEHLWYCMKDIKNKPTQAECLTMADKMSSYSEEDRAKKYCLKLR